MATNFLHRRSRRFGFEPLEERTLMAGDVTASVVNGTLSIKGDAQSNQVQLVQFLRADGTPDPGNFILMRSDSSTTINGSSSRSFTGVTNISIDLGDGDDQLTVGDGNVNHFIAPGSLNIYNGSGNDSIKLNRITVWSFLDIYTDGRHSDNTFSDGLGNNTIDVAGNFNITNSNSFSQIKLGNGTDSVVVHDATLNSLSITAAMAWDPAVGPPPSGDKTIDLYNVTIAGSTRIITGTGNDTVILDHVTHNSCGLGIITGNGADNVTLNSCKVNDLTVSLEGGADTIHLNNVQGHTSNVDGGDGYDQYFEGLGTHFTDGETLGSFEPFRLPPLKLNPYTGW